MSIKQDSFALTNLYLQLICREVLVQADGGDARVSDINTANQIRMEINAADEAIRYQIKRCGVRKHDPDLDWY